MTQHNLTLLVTWINEHQRWNASRFLGNAANASDDLNTVRATAMYMYDLTYAVYGGYFTTFGSRDTGLFQPEAISGSRPGRPDTSGFILELDWLPFNKFGGPSCWPWLNAKLSLQYVVYTEFNGAGRNYDGSNRSASDNDTLFLSAWIAF